MTTTRKKKTFIIGKSPIEVHYFVYPTNKEAYKAHLWVEKNEKNKSEFYRQGVTEKVEDIKNKAKW